MQHAKPALILDDSPSDVQMISRSLRLFGGVDVEYHKSIPAWERKYHIKFDLDQTNPHQTYHEQLANKLKQYGTIVVDNNFEAAGYPDNGVTGLPFLTDNVAPTLELLPPEERPLVVCFAPSNTELILQKKEELWQKHGIVSFHKIFEAPFIGLITGLSREGGVSLSRENVITDIFGLKDTTIEYDTAATLLSAKITSRYLEKDEIFGDNIEGLALPFNASSLPTELAKMLNLPEKELLKRIDQTINQIRIAREGNGSPQAKK